MRIFSALTGLGLTTAAGYGVYRAHVIYTEEAPAPSGTNQAVGICNGGKSQQEFAVYLGLMCVYFCLCGILMFLAELRFYRLQITVLRPFGFLHSWLGRGCFMIILGSIFVELPLAPQKQVYIAYIPAAFCIAMGILQIVISVFVRKEEGLIQITRPQTTTTQQARAIDWDMNTSTGSSEGAAAPFAGGASAGDAEGGGPGTPSKKALVPKTTSGKGASVGAGKDSVVTKNPFLSATKDSASSTS